MMDQKQAKRLHILFLPRWYPNRYDPMFGLFVQRHAEAVALKHSVSVVYVTESEAVTQKKYSIIQTEDKGVFNTTVYYQKSLLKPSFIAKVINLRRFVKANMAGIDLAKKKFGPFQLIHVHILTRLGLIAFWYKLKFSIPYIITEHWSRYLPLTNGFNGFWRKKATELVVRHASAITTVTKNLAEAMKNHGLNNPDYVVLPNVVDVKLFKIHSSKMNRPIRMVHISCFEDRSKNISGIIKALRLLSKERQDFECVFVGDGIDYHAIKNSSSDLESTGLVRFTGLLQDEKLVEVLSSSDFLVLFSNYENMPVVILEAFACGLPVVATRVGGIPEMVNEGKGLLVDTANEFQLVDALKKMLNSFKEYNAEQLRESVRSTNSYEAVSGFLNDIYLKSIK
jgi:glycosyltransferase involved in cell wall biosynthesis